MLNNHRFSFHCRTLYGVSFGTLRGVKPCSFYNVLLHIVSSTLLIKSHARARTRTHAQEREREREKEREREREVLTVNCQAVSIPDRLFLHRFGFSCIKIKKSCHSW